MPNDDQYYKEHETDRILMNSFHEEGAAMQIQQFSKQYNRLSRELLQYSIGANPGGNIIISPFSVILLMAMAADSSGGRTRDEILSALNFDPAGNDFHDMLTQYQRILKITHSFNSANAVLIRKDMSQNVHSVYRRMIMTDYEGACIDSDDLQNDANYWVAIQTKQMIPRAIDNLSDDIKLLFLNAVAFDDTWSDPYDDVHACPDDFRNADGTVSRPIMLSGSEWSYIEDQDFTGFTKDYKNDHFAFMGLLPRKQLTKITAGDVSSIDFSRLFAKRTFKRVWTKVPEFSFSFDSQLVPFCQSQGIHQIFTDQADFSPISDYPLKANGFLHKAYIDLSRGGTRAAAESALYLVTGCLPNYNEIERVYLTRPFIFAIIHKETGLPVFTGVVNQPD